VAAQSDETLAQRFEGGIGRVAFLGAYRFADEPAQKFDAAAHGAFAFGSVRHGDRPRPAVGA